MQHKQQKNEEITFVYCLCLIANILLRVFNIRFIRLENYTLYDYVISVHVRESNSMSPITDEGNVDLMEWDGHILKVGEVQYVTVAVFYSSLIRLSGIDIFLPTVGFWDNLFVIPSIRITEHMDGDSLDFSHPNFHQEKKKRHVVETAEKKGRILMSPGRLPVKKKYFPADQEEQETLLDRKPEAEGDEDDEDGNEDGIPQLEEPGGGEGVTSREEKESRPLQCSLVFAASHGLQLKAMKPMLRRFYEDDPLISAIQLDPLVLLGLYRYGNSRLLVLNMKEDVLFGRVNLHEAAGKDIESHGGGGGGGHEDELARLDVLLTSQQRFYRHLKRMTYYEPWDEIFLTRNALDEVVCKKFYGGADYERLRLDGFEPWQAARKKAGDGASRPHIFSSTDRVAVEPIQFALLFYFYVIVLLQDIDSNLARTLEAKETREYAKFFQDQGDDPLPAQPRDLAPLRRGVSSSRLSLENFQAIDIETLMKVYLMKNTGGLVNKVVVKLLNAYNEFIILVLALVQGRSSGPEIFLVLVNAVVVGFANASRDIMSAHCGKKWYGSGDAWNEATGQQLNNLYTDHLLVYYVSLCMSALTQLTLTDPRQDAINLLVWSLAQVYLALTAFTLICMIGSAFHTPTGLKIAPPYNKSLPVAIFFALLCCLIPVAINLIVWFTPFAVLCVLMGLLQIVFVLGVRFNREPHRFANALFYSTIAELLKLLVQAARYFAYLFEPRRLRKLCHGLVFAYENHLNDLLMVAVGLLVFGGSILLVQFYAVN